MFHPKKVGALHRLLPETEIFIYYYYYYYLLLFIAIIIIIADMTVVSPVNLPSAAGVRPLHLLLLPDRLPLPLFWLPLLMLVQNSVECVRDICLAAGTENHSRLTATTMQHRTSTLYALEDVPVLSMYVNQSIAIWDTVRTSTSNPYLSTSSVTHFT